MHSSDETGTASDDPDNAYGPEHRRALLDIACRSIAHGLAHGTPLPVQAERHAPALREQRATFVTLKRRDELRGCIGSLEAGKPLANDVADNAYSSALADPRFLPLARDELDGLAVWVAVLSPPQPMFFDSESTLIAQLRPGIDGLVLEEGTRYRSTFLPIVWESLPRPEAFLHHLKLKAGLPGDHWSDTLRVTRYTTENFGAGFREITAP